MKNKIVKMMVLIILPVLFLTGCGNWEEDKEQYSDILNKGVSCIYSPAEKYKSDKFGIQTIKFSADNNGLFIKFNSNSPSEIYGPNGYKEKHEFGKNKFSIAQNVTQDFLNYYLEKNKCPEKIYIDGLQKHFSLEIISSFTEPIEYELGTSTVLTPENEERTCHHGSADDCRKMVKKITECSENGETIYIEYGYYDKSKKYFGISSNDNYTDIRIDEDDSDGFLVQFGNKKSNFVIREDAINDIWKSDNTLAPITEIVISCDVNMGRQYYISGKSSAPDEGGVIIDGGDTQESKDKDDTYQSSISVPEISEHNCTSLLGDPSDKDTPSPAFLLTYAFKIIRYIAIVLLVVMSIMDFIESVSSQDKDSMNKAISKTVRRIIYCVLIFLLPSLLEFILTLLNDHAVNICINS